MLGKLLRKLWLKQLHNYNSPSSQAEPLSRSLQANLNLVREAFGKATDLVVREFNIGSEQIKACLIFIDGLDRIKKSKKVLLISDPEVLKDVNIDVINANRQNLIVTEEVFEAPL